MAEVNVYEIELIVCKSDQTEELLKSTQHAYGVMDALQQCVLTRMPQFGAGATIRRVVRIGPAPKEHPVPAAIKPMPVRSFEVSSREPTLNDLMLFNGAADSPDAAVDAILMAWLEPTPTVSELSAIPPNVKLGYLGLIRFASLARMTRIKP